MVVINEVAANTLRNTYARQLQNATDEQLDEMIKTSMGGEFLTALQLEHKSRGTKESMTDTRKSTNSKKSSGCFVCFSDGNEVRDASE